MERLPGLDLLRALAIVWVMLFHSWLVGGLGAPFGAVQESGWMAVDLFFVLSGYLIGGQLLRPLRTGQPLAFGRFYARRSLRVFPAYLVVLALYFLWPGFNREGRLSPVWQFLSYTLNLLIDYEHAPAFSHAWSLCVEEHFYLLFPPVAWLLARRRSTALTLGCVAALTIGGMLLRAVLWPRGQQRFLEVLYYPTWCRLDGLSAGVLLATLQLYRPRAWAFCLRHANDVVLPAGLALLALAFAVCRARTSFAAVVAGYPLLALAFALIVLAGASPRGLLARLRIPGASWIAAISYSLYLIHKAIFVLVARWLPPTLAGRRLLTFACYAFATLAAGALLHGFVEQPFLRLRARLLRRTETDGGQARASTSVRVQ